MSDLAGPGEPRLRSPSPGRGGRFDDGGRRSPPPSTEKWNTTNDRNGNNALPARGRSVEFGKPSVWLVSLLLCLPQNLSILPIHRVDCPSIPI